MLGGFVKFCWGWILFSLVGLVWFGLAWFCLVWFSLVWFVLVWFGLVWFGVVGVVGVVRVVEDFEVITPVFFTIHGYAEIGCLVTFGLV